MADFNNSIAKLLQREGGDKYTEIKGDLGGGTKYGISQRSFPAIDIEYLTETRAREIYKREYWDKVRGDEVDNQRIANLMFDTAVNMSPYRAIKFAQMCLGVPADGVVGPNTLGSINHVVNADAFIAAYSNFRIARYVAIVGDDPTQAKFLQGWKNRVAEVCNDAF